MSKTQVAQASESVTEVPVKIKWRDVLHLEIKDQELRGHVERFLDKFERSAFQYDLKHPTTGNITRHTLSGQWMLEQMRARLNEYDREMPHIYDAMRTENLKYGFTTPIAEGKFTIGDHPHHFDGGNLTGCNTSFLGTPKGRRPGTIHLGHDYLKGAQYKGTGWFTRYHPVTVEGALANELSHLVHGTDEKKSNEAESIITVPLGAPPRDPDGKIRFKRGSNGGYQTLKYPDKKAMMDAPEKTAPTSNHQPSPLA